MILTINPNLRLELTQIKHAGGLYKAIDNNRAHLSAFLPWVGNMQTVNDVENYLRSCEKLYDAKNEVSFIIFFNDEAVGRIGLHYIHQQNKTAAIGYWLSKSAEGNGIISTSCKAIINYGFTVLQLHRIEIKAAVKNNRSRAIPVRLGFTQEGILRQAELVNNEFLDLALYSLLQHEWKEK